MSPGEVERRLGDPVRRTGTARIGVYVLAGPDPERPGGTLAYIGEADDVAAGSGSIRSTDKDFFDRLAIVISVDENLTKVHCPASSRAGSFGCTAGRSCSAGGRNGADFQRLPEDWTIEFFSDH